MDDGSDDGSLAELLRVRQGDSRVRIISFTRNFGQMAAILAGLKAATGDLVLHLSADLQDPVELIPRMVRDYEAGSELVIAHREEREDAWTSRVTSRLFYRIIRLSFPQLPAGGFDYVLMARRVVESFNNIEIRNRFFQGDLPWMGYKTTFIPYTRVKYTIGRSRTRSRNGSRTRWMRFSIRRISPSASSAAQEPWSRWWGFSMRSASPTGGYGMA